MCDDCESRRDNHGYQCGTDCAFYRSETYWRDNLHLLYPNEVYPRDSIKCDTHREYDRDLLCPECREMREYAGGGQHLDEYVEAKLNDAKAQREGWDMPRKEFPRGGWGHGYGEEGETEYARGESSGYEERERSYSPVYEDRRSSYREDSPLYDDRRDRERSYSPVYGSRSYKDGYEESPEYGETFSPEGNRREFVIDRDRGRWMEVVGYNSRGQPIWENVAR